MKGEKFARITNNLTYSMRYCVWREFSGRRVPSDIERVDTNALVEIHERGKSRLFGDDKLSHLDVSKQKHPSTGRLGMSNLDHAGIVGSESILSERFESGNVVKTLRLA